MNYAHTRRVPLAGIRSSASHRRGGGSLRLPWINLAWCCCAASVTSILSGNLVGSIGAYAFLALWGLFAMTRLRASWRALAHDPGIWLFPAFALASCIWSYHHMMSLRFGLQFVATVGCATIAARLLSPRQLIGALLVSLTAIAVLCVAIGRSNFNQLTQTVDFVGIFRTKNELAFLISLLLLAAATTLLDSASRPVMRLLAAASVVPAVPLLVRAHSATSLVTTVIALAVLLGNFAIARLQPRERARVLLMGAVMLLPLLALVGLASDAAQDFIVHVLGRSGTMTGRTVLWQRALELIPQHSMLGWGWQAFWVQNSALAEGLWAKFHIAGRQGFQFQNTFLEAAIELGWAGCALLVVAMLTTLRRTVRWSWRERSLVSSFHVALMVCLLIRAMVEVDILYQFSIGAFVFFATMCQASDRGRRWPRHAGRPIGQDHRVGPPHGAAVARHAPN